MKQITLRVEDDHYQVIAKLAALRGKPIEEFVLTAAKSADSAELENYNRQLLKFVAEVRLAFRHLSQSPAMITTGRSYVALTKALHQMGRLEELMNLENRLEKGFLKPFKNELPKRDGPSPLALVAGRLLGVSTFAGRSFP